MSTELAVITSDLGELPPLARLVDVVERLVRDQASAELSEIQRRAEARSLYERRSGEIGRERHFAKLRLLAEAGLGVLSYDEPNLVEGVYRLGQWRALAAGFERGVLLQFCGDSTTTSTVVAAIRRHGYTHALIGKSSTRWAEARMLLRDQGVDFRSVPPDKTYIERLNENAVEASTRMLKFSAALERLARIERRKHIRTEVDERGPKTARLYALLRQTVAAAEDAQGEIGRRDREAYDSIFRNLYRAEDAIGDLLRVEPVEEIEQYLAKRRVRQRYGSA